MLLLKKMTKHNIEPVYNQDSRILILGSFPSVKSREAKFFYHHPQNRFWKVLAALFQEEVPQTIEEKKTFLLRNHLALWDVIESCDIKGSSDSSITNVKVNDLDLIVKNCPNKKIITNGKAANRYIINILIIIYPLFNYLLLHKRMPCIHLKN